MCPVDRLASPKGRALVESCRAQIASEGYCILPDFVTAEALAQMTEVSRAVAPLAYVSKIKTNVYFGADDESLPAEHQAILEYSAEAANTASYGWAMDIYSADLQKLINEHGVNVYRTETSIMKAQLDSWDKVLERLNRDPFFKKVVDSQKVWSERVAFYDIVNAADYKLAYEHYFPGKLPF